MKKKIKIIILIIIIAILIFGGYKITENRKTTISKNNNSSKMKRWKSILEVYNYELLYKPCRANVVVDAFSRILEAQVYTLSVPTNSDESSCHNFINSVETPINGFKNQIFLKEDIFSFY